jgi:hypothetical protein
VHPQDVSEQGVFAQAPGSAQRLAGPVGGAGCAPTFSVMMAASLAVMTWVCGKVPPVVFRRGLGVRGGGFVISLT